MADRQIVYPQETPYDTDVLSTNKDSYIGLGRLIAAVLGESVEINGLEAIPTVSPSLAVNVKRGEIYILETTDPVAYGSLGTDSNPLMKQGVYFGSSAPFSTPAPVTVGFSIDYLIQVEFSETQTDLQVRQYWNAAEPTNPFNIPSLSLLKDEAVVSIKAGTAATTGTQVPPTPDADNYGLWVITVAHGQTTVVAGDIIEYENAPYMIVDKLKDKVAFSAIQYSEGIINGGMVIAQRENLTLTGTAAVGLVDLFAGFLTDASAGTLTQTDVAPIGQTGYALHFSGISTSVATGTVGFVHRIESNNSINYNNQTASFSVLVEHDFGIDTNFVIRISSANAKNNFSAVTMISTSAPITVETDTPTQLTFPNIAMGDVFNGIQIEVIGDYTAQLSTNNLYFTEAQLNSGATLIPFIYRDETRTRDACQRQYKKSYEDGVALGTVTQVGNVKCLVGNGQAGDMNLYIPLPQTMLKVPTVNVWNPSTGALGSVHIDSPSENLTADAVDTATTGFVIVNVDIATTADSVARGHFEAKADLF